MVIPTNLNKWQKRCRAKPKTVHFLILLQILCSPVHGKIAQALRKYAKKKWLWHWKYAKQVYLTFEPMLWRARRSTTSSTKTMFNQDKVAKWKSSFSLHASFFMLVILFSERESFLDSLHKSESFFSLTNQSVFSYLLFSWKIAMTSLRFYFIWKLPTNLSFGEKELSLDPSFYASPHRPLFLR